VAAAIGIGVVPFFSVHYGMFTLIHGVFVISLFGGVDWDATTSPRTLEFRDGKISHLGGSVHGHAPTGIHSHSEIQPSLRVLHFNVVESPLPLGPPNSSGKPSPSRRPRSTCSGCVHPISARAFGNSYFWRAVARTSQSAVIASSRLFPNPKESLQRARSQRLPDLDDFIGDHGSKAHGQPDADRLDR
jgi:hypothetical protein